MEIHYFAQQSINALVLSCIYALLAIGYTLVYSIIGRINLAFGDFSTIGAYATLAGVALVPLAQAPLALSLLSAGLVALIAGAATGGVAERLVFRPFYGVATQAPLIVTVGLVIFVQEYLRLVFGPDNIWLPQVLDHPYRIAQGAGFTVSMTPLQVFIVLLAMVAFIILLLILRHSRFGRYHRACADDAGMAALCGVDVTATIRQTFLLATAYAGLAGFIMAFYYGVVNFHMGFIYGIKALTAALIGGIGSITGALLGAALLALLEVFWSAYVSLAYRDVAVFGLLVGVLVLRPNGLLNPAGPVRIDRQR